MDRPPRASADATPSMAAFQSAYIPRLYATSLEHVAHRFRATADGGAAAGATSLSHAGPDAASDSGSSSGVTASSCCSEAEYLRAWGSYYDAHACRSEDDGASDFCEASTSDGSNSCSAPVQPETSDLSSAGSVFNNPLFNGSTACSRSNSRFAAPRPATPERPVSAGVPPAGAASSSLLEYQAVAEARRQLEGIRIALNAVRQTLTGTSATAAALSRPASATAGATGAAAESPSPSYGAYYESMYGGMAAPPAGVAAIATPSPPRPGPALLTPARRRPVAYRSVWGWLEPQEGCDSLNPVLLRGPGVAIGRNRPLGNCGPGRSAGSRSAAAGSAGGGGANDEAVAEDTDGLGFVRVEDGRVSRRHCTIRPDRFAGDANMATIQEGAVVDTKMTAGDAVLCK